MQGGRTVASGLQHLSIVTGFGVNWGEGYCEDVTDKKNIARGWVITGFALTTLGSIVNVIQLLNHGYLSQGFRSDIQLFAVPLGSLAALWAWWMLSKIATLVSDFNSTFRSAFLGLMVASLCLCVVYVNLLWSAHTFSQFTWPFWLQGLGPLVTAMGFFLLSLTFSSSVKLDALTSD